MAQDGLKWGWQWSGQGACQKAAGGALNRPALPRLERGDASKCLSALKFFMASWQAGVLTVGFPPEIMALILGHRVGKGPGLPPIGAMKRQGITMRLFVADKPMRAAASFIVNLKEFFFMFPEYRDLITQLKTTDHHFTRLFDQHNAVDQQIQNMESRIEAATPEEIELLKKEKLQLKDQLYAILKQADTLA